MVPCARPWYIISRNQIGNGWPGLVHKELLSQALSKLLRVGQADHRNSCPLGFPPIG